MNTFAHRTRLHAPAEEVLRWIERPGAFERLTPPWEKVHVVPRDRGRFMPFVHNRVVKHRYLVESDGEAACYLEDRIEYELPMGALGHAVLAGMVRRRLERMFAYRSEVLAADLAAHARFRRRGPLRVLISGSTGMLGSALIPFLTTGGHEVVRLVRRPVGKEEAITWNPSAGELDAAQLEGFDAFIHLSGEYIADGHWNRSKRERVWSSRVDTTKLLVRAISQLKQPPKVLVCASGTGFYGEGGARELDEDSPPGESCFFVDMVKAWEAAAQEASACGVRVVNCRIGVVLSPVGGALKSMLPAFRWGGGSVLGSGREATGWVTLDDLIGMMHFAVMCDELRGPVNFVVPQPVTQHELSAAIGRVLHRPVWFRIPNAAVRWIFSPELAEAMSWSQRVVPRRLMNAAYRYRYPDLDHGLKHVLGIRGDVGGAA
jgi:uncharacterized protein (TIGR01777 family)